MRELELPGSMEPARSSAVGPGIGGGEAIIIRDAQKPPAESAAVSEAARRKSGLSGPAAN
jgi:hypothetical protein